MRTTIILGLVTGALAICISASAAERKAYKHVDEKGNVTYSQTPPDESAKTVNIAPAHSGRGGYTPPASRYEDPRTYSGDGARQQHNDALRARQKQQEEARQRRLAELQAECNRNRGTDCNDPKALRYQGSTQIPGGYRR